MKLEQPTSSRLAISVNETDHIRGPLDAPVTLVEYGDYECPWCAKAHPVLAQLRERSGTKVRLVYRHFPQSSIHAHASTAAQVAEAAGAQGKFWEMHDLLFEHQDRLADVDYDRFALRIGLEVYRFNSDIVSGRFVARVKQDLEGGRLSGVTGTPTFFINGLRHTGELSLEALAEAIDRAAGQAQSS